MKRVTGLIVLTLLLGCGKREHPLAAGSIAAPAIRFEQAIYFLPSAPPNISAVVDQLLASKYKGLRRVVATPNDVRKRTVAVRLEHDVQHKYTPPDLNALKYFGNGLTAEQGQSLQQSRDALVLQFAHPRSEVWPGLHDATELMLDVARATGGLIWDEAARKVYTAEAWEKERLAGWSASGTDVSKQTAIHYYQNGEFKRFVTLGMAKLGLPDIAVEGGTASNQNQVAGVINLLSQALAERPVVGAEGVFDLDIHKIRNAAVRESQLAGVKDNGTGVARLRLVEGTSDEGDADNRLIAISANRYKGNDEHARMEAMFMSLFGSSDSVKHIKDTDELLEASRKAREHLPQLRAAFNTGLAPGESIEVKAPFATDDGNTEWMWVEVTKWNGNAIRGVLDNEPEQIRSLQAGQVVDVEEAKVFDYTFTHKDGRREGNTTGAIIEKE